LRVRLSHRLELWLVKMVLWWAGKGGWAKIPARAEVIGSLLYLLLGMRRKTAIDNIHCALGYPVSRCRRLARESFKSIVITALEMAQMGSLNPRWIGGRVQFDNTESFEEVYKLGKGGLLLSAHLGNWELVGALVGRKGMGYPVSVLVQEQSNPLVEGLMRRLRQGYGFYVISLGEAGRKMVQLLRRGEFVALLPDQDAGPEGRMFPFFGRYASTNIGPALLASRLGTPIIIGFCVRSPDRTYRAYISKPYILGKDRERAVVRYLELYSGFLEEYVRRYPRQYLWMHRRWKSYLPKKGLKD